MLTAGIVTGTVEPLLAPSPPTSSSAPTKKRTKKSQQSGQAPAQSVFKARYDPPVRVKHGNATAALVATAVTVIGLP